MNKSLIILVSQMTRRKEGLGFLHLYIIKIITNIFRSTFKEKNHIYEDFFIHRFKYYFLNFYICKFSKFILTVFTIKIKKVFVFC